jgi:hypothetical protein
VNARVDDLAMIVLSRSKNAASVTVFKLAGFPPHQPSCSRLSSPIPSKDGE